LFYFAPQTRLLNPVIDLRANNGLLHNEIQLRKDADELGGEIMSKKDNKKKSDKSAAKSCCYYVVDACGCVVGTYCCDGSEMSSCRFESCC
jgi:hypothetical protein